MVDIFLLGRFVCVDTVIREFPQQVLWRIFNLPSSRRCEYRDGCEVLAQTELIDANPSVA